MARTLANIVKNNYRILHRATATFDQPTSAAEWTTFLATFTELGYCRDKTIKATVGRGDQETLDDGTKKVMGYNGKLEGILLQSKAADYTAYETIEGDDLDVILVDETNLVCNFFPHAILFFEESVAGGETETVPFVYERENMASKSTFRIRFAIPTT